MRGILSPNCYKEYRKDASQETPDLVNENCCTNKRRIKLALVQ